MSFRLFGIDVEIQAFFWVMAGLFGLPFLNALPMKGAGLVVWILVVLISVMIHELGHAFAMMRHGMKPSITLHGMGGHTSWNCIPQLTRFQHVIVSLAGPFAGFALAGLVYAVAFFAPGAISHLPAAPRLGLSLLLWANVWWGVLNLAPVLPFDGGHVLEHALGPTRIRITAIISMLAGAGLAVYFITDQNVWMAMLFARGAFFGWQRYQSAAPLEPVAGTARRPAAPEIPAEVQAVLQSARHALAQDDLDRAIKLAQEVISGIDGRPSPAPAPFQAMEILASAHLAAGRIELAASIVAKAERLGDPDAALVGALLLAQDKLNGARVVLEAARAKGDARKEVAGPLIQILITQGEVARAAAVAYDIIESLSSDDARKMAEIALEHRVFDWSARLSQAVFERNKQPDDAYEVARALARDGQRDQALAWLKRAVEAGFSDGARAWSDEALETLRGAELLETVLPRP
jgi:Zn-dependent protease/tetratricopeptide (TPR) repeat protein